MIIAFDPRLDHTSARKLINTLMDEGTKRNHCEFSDSNRCCVEVRMRRKGIHKSAVQLSRYSRLQANQGSADQNAIRFRTPVCACGIL
jgi:hypothetical protein